MGDQPSNTNILQCRLGSLSTFAVPLIVRESCAVWLIDMDRITATCRRSKVSITEISGFGICVPRLFSTIIPTASSSIWAAQISASIFTILASRIRSMSRQSFLAHAWTGSRSGVLYRFVAPRQREEVWRHQWYPQILPPQRSRCSYQIVFS